MKLIKWIGFGLGLFIIFTIIIFVSMMYIVPPLEPIGEATLDSVADSLLKANTVQREELEKILGTFKNHKDSLENLVLEVNNAAREKEFAIDSLQKALDANYASIKKKEAELEQLANLIKSGQNKSEKAKEIAKTFGSMDTKQIAPILNRLDNETVICIYEQMNSRTKKNILLGLPQERAALITKKMLE